MMRKVYITLYFLLIFDLSTFGQVFPGGVNTNMTLWLKANTQQVGKITTVAPTNAVSSWENETNNYSVNQATAARRPIFNDNPTGGVNEYFNFNPFIQFNAGNNTNLGGASTPDLLGSNGTIFIVTNNNGQVYGSGNLGPSGLTYSSSSSIRYQLKPLGRIQTGNNFLGYTSDFNGGPPVNFPPTSCVQLTSRGVGTPFHARRNGYQFTQNNSGLALYFPSVGLGLSIGSNSGNSEYSSAAVAEVIFYNSNLNNTDVNKVESYLALKYGITLSQQVTATDYTASDGTVFWSGAANTGYGNNITGIGRDDNSQLNQKQSISVNSSKLVYIFNDSLSAPFPTMNQLNSSNFTDDKLFLVYGDNNLSTDLGVCINNGKMKRMNRIWKVQKTGSIQQVTLAIQQTQVNANIKLLLVSTDPTFPQANTTSYALNNSNNYLYKNLNLNNGDYFTFASDSLEVELNIVGAGCQSFFGSVSTTVTGGIAPYTFQWNTNPIQTTASINNLLPGNYDLTITHGSSPACQVVFPAAISSIGPMPLVNAVPIAPVCIGESVTISANSSISGGQFLWQPGNINSQQFTISPTTSTHYVVTVTNNGCTSIPDTVNVAVSPTPAILQTLGTTICEGQIATLTALADSANATFEWQPGSISGNQIQVIPTQTTQYTVTASLNNCKSSPEIVVVTVNPIPEIIGLNDTSVCDNQLLILNAQSDLPNTNFLWQPTGTIGSQLIITSPENQTYSIIGEAEGCVSAPYSLTVNVNPIPFLTEFTQDLEFCLSQSVTLSAGTNIQNSNFYWLPINETGSTITFNPTQSTTVIVIAEANGCYAEPDTVQLTAIDYCPCVFEVPNVFTPNGDNLNDVFEVIYREGCLYDSYSLEVYNRWGKNIWSAQSPVEKWNGLNNNELSPEGTYYWVLQYSFFETTGSKTKKISGFVSLMK